MKMNLIKNRVGVTLVILITAFYACKDETPELGSPPSASEAGFTFTESSTTPNILIFTANSPNVIAHWDFGNKTSGEGITATGIYPAKGTYTVTLTIFAKGGRAESKQEVVIANDDPTLLANPLYTMLTGGIDSLNGKAWVIDSMNTAHFGVGPEPIGAAGEYPEYYAANALEKQGAGFYDDRYRFNINGFRYDMITNGNVYVNAQHKDAFPGAVMSPVSDYIAPFPDQLDVSWSIEETADDTIITVSGGSFIGYYTGVSSYSVIKFTENELFMRQLDTKDGALTWYIRLIPEGYINTGGGGTGGGGGGGNPGGAGLPIDFESSPPDFESFGGSTDTVITNPDKRGINFSEKVLETDHGFEPWAGISVNLNGKLNFSNDTNIALKVWSPNFGDSILVKLEDQANSNAFVEKKVAIPVAFTWVEVSVGFSSADSDLYDKLVLFPGWNRPNAGKYYIDEIEQK